MRARPLSITAPTSSMVTELSATLVERMILRRSRGADGAVLLLRRLVAMEREDGQPCRCAMRGARRLRAADLGGAGEEDEDMARSVAEAFERGGDLLLERRRGVGRVLDLERKVAALGAEDAGVAEVRGDGRGIQSRGHDDEAEVGASGSLEASQEGEGEVAFEMALVELVEDDGGRRVRGAGRRAGGA